MMHDALRADVLAVLLSATPAEVAEHRAEIDEHGATFLEMQDANADLITDRRLLETLQEARPALEDYLASARRIADVAATDRDGGVGSAPGVRRRLRRARDRAGGALGAHRARASRPTAPPAPRWRPRRSGRSSSAPASPCSS